MSLDIYAGLHLCKTSNLCLCSNIGYLSHSWSSSYSSCSPSSLDTYHTAGHLLTRPVHHHHWIPITQLVIFLLVLFTIIIGYLSHSWSSSYSSCSPSSLDTYHTAGHLLTRPVHHHHWIHITQLVIFLLVLFTIIIGYLSHSWSSSYSSCSPSSLDTYHTAGHLLTRPVHHHHWIPITQLVIFLLVLFTIIIGYLSHSWSSSYSSCSPSSLDTYHTAGHLLTRPVHHHHWIPITQLVIFLLVLFTIIIGYLSHSWSSSYSSCSPSSLDTYHTAGHLLTRPVHHHHDTYHTAGRLLTRPVHHHHWIPITQLVIFLLVLFTMIIG